MGKNSPPNYYTAKQNQRAYQRIGVLEARIEILNRLYENEQARAEQAFKMLTEAKMLHATQVKQMQQMMDSIRFSALCWASYLSKNEHDPEHAVVIKDVKSYVESQYG